MKILSGEQKWWRARKKGKKENSLNKKNIKYCFKNHIPAVYIIQ